MRQALLEVGAGAGLPEAPVGLGEVYLGSMCSVSRSALVLPAQASAPWGPSPGFAFIPPGRVRAHLPLSPQPWS